MEGSKVIVRQVLWAAVLGLACGGQASAPPSGQPGSAPDVTTTSPPPPQGATPVPSAPPAPDATPPPTSPVPTTADPPPTAVPPPAANPPPTYVGLDRTAWTATLAHGSAGRAAQAPDGHVYALSITGSFPSPSYSYLEELDAGGRPTNEQLLGDCLGSNLLGVRSDGNLVLAVPSGCTPTSPGLTIQVRAPDGTLLSTSDPVIASTAALASDGSVFSVGRAPLLMKLGPDGGRLWTAPVPDGSRVAPLADGGALVLVLLGAPTPSLRRYSADGQLVWEKASSAQGLAVQSDGTMAVWASDEAGLGRVELLGADGAVQRSSSSVAGPEVFGGLSPRPGGGWLVTYQREVEGRHCAYLRAYSEALEVLWDGGLGATCTLSAQVGSGREHVLVSSEDRVVALRP